MKFLFAASDLRTVETVRLSLAEAGIGHEVRSKLSRVQGALVDYSELWVLEGGEYEFAQLISTPVFRKVRR